MRKLIGICTILLLITITIILWLLSKEDKSTILQNPIKSLNQLFALIGVVLISIQAVLATRARLLEKLFGGLDQVYLVHRITGSLGFAIILQHPVMLVVNALPNTTAALSYIFPNINSLANFFGILALVVLSILLIASLFIKMPYHLWKKTHIFMGIPVIFAFIHVFLVSSDTSVYMPLRTWIMSIIIISLFSAFYRRFLYSSLAPHYKYEISYIGISNSRDVLKIVLKPLSQTNILENKPGDFAYIKFDHPLVGKEKHPFSISSSPASQELCMIIKINGDYTQKLINLRVNDTAVLWGPYGGFADAYQHNKQDQVWIAGGIGVTPFLSILPCEVQQQCQQVFKISRFVTFYYCVNNDSEAIFKNDIHKQFSQVNGLEFKLVTSNTHGRLTAKKIAQDIGKRIHTSKFFLCGPPVMMEDMTRQLQDLGVKNNQIFYENFSFLS